MSTILRATHSRIPLSHYSRPLLISLRSFVTDWPRPPPPNNQPAAETFSSTSRPKPYYAKHPPHRDLPQIKKKWPTILAVGLVGLSAWAAFLVVVTNQEKISSSVVTQIMRSVRNDAQLKEVLGEAIRPQPQWWLNGDPFINGHISQLQGNVDISFRIKGSKGSGTIYFTSIRKEKGVPFTILRFKVICDDGNIIHVDAAPA